jgi:hypothetical protein
MLDGGAGGQKSGISEKRGPDSVGIVIVCDGCEALVQRAQPSERVGIRRRDEAPQDIAVDYPHTRMCSEMTGTILGVVDLCRFQPREDLPKIVKDVGAEGLRGIEEGVREQTDRRTAVAIGRLGVSGRALIVVRGRLEELT